MKILQVVHGFPPYNIAGTEIYTYNLTRELSKKNEVFVFHRINSFRMKEYELTYNELEGLKIFKINNTFSLYNSFDMTYKNKAIAHKFCQVLDLVQPNIVHIQHLLYLSVEIINEIKKRDIPIIFTLNDYWLICPQGQLLKNNGLSCQGANNSDCIECVLYQLSIKRYIFNIYYFLNRYFPEFLFQMIKKSYLNCHKRLFLNKNFALNLIEERITHMKNICSIVDLFIAPSNFLREKFIEFDLPKEKIFLLNYGFNLENFKKFQRTPSVKLRFGFIGNILPAKGVHILIKAFNKIENNNVELKIYGKQLSYKGELGNYLEYIKKLAKNKNIKFMNEFDNKNISTIFEGIDVLIVPSIWYENSPLVIQEAFAFKTPVVASRIGGIPELINHGENGFLFEPNSYEDLFRTVNTIIKKPSLIEELKQNIRMPQSIEENTKVIEDIYKGLCGYERKSI